MRSRVLGVLALGVLLFACGQADDEDASSTEDGAVSALSDDWTVLGTGVAYKNTGEGDGVFIGYAGYSVQQPWSCAWTEALYRARLHQLGAGHLYCVAGPRDAGYGGREIANSKLAAHLVTGPAANASFVFVAAHSSGTYVAHELLNDLRTSPDTLAKVVYANLDGGETGLDRALVGSLKKVGFFFAHDPTLPAGRSANAGEMEALGATYGRTTHELTLPSTGCASGAKWCLHDVLITTKPHNPSSYDLEHDYTDFEDRPVQVGWIDALADSLR